MANANDLIPNENGSSRITHYLKYPILESLERDISEDFMIFDDNGNCNFYITDVITDFLGNIHYTGICRLYVGREHIASFWDINKCFDRIKDIMTSPTTGLPLSLYNVIRVSYVHQGVEFKNGELVKEM